MTMIIKFEHGYKDEARGTQVFPFMGVNCRCYVAPIVNFAVQAVKAARAVEKLKKELLKCQIKRSTD